MLPQDQKCYFDLGVCTFQETGFLINVVGQAFVIDSCVEFLDDIPFHYVEHVEDAQGFVVTADGL